MFFFFYFLSDKKKKKKKKKKRFNIISINIISIKQRDIIFISIF